MATVMQVLNNEQQQQRQSITELQRGMALCESCFWSATIFISAGEINRCPLCEGKNVSLIPLTIDEGYRIKISDTAGVEISFLRTRR